MIEKKMKLRGKRVITLFDQALFGHVERVYVDC